MRQGDLLSPLFFIAVIEYLVCLTNKEVADKKLEVYVIGGTPVEPILAFTDDIAFFVRASTASMSKLHDILLEFSTFSGLQINHVRSTIVFSKSINIGD